MRNFKSTAEIKVPKSLIDQVIGQDKAVKIIKKAARQRRHVLMIGQPGTGKSMLAQAMAELMPVTLLEDVLVYPNPNDENKPLVRAVPTYPSNEEIRKDPLLQALYARLRAASNFTPAPKEKEKGPAGASGAEGAAPQAGGSQAGHATAPTEGASGGLMFG
ncbi:MAG: ATP-binding protein, partial [Candidatus Micrarchaeota archaeon]|nr:ATP-binding protein [Candidatus Micrarchaeota archaeon]